MNKPTWQSILNGLGASGNMSVIVNREYGIYDIEINGEHMIQNATHTDLMALVTVLSRLIGERDMKTLIKLSRKLPDVGVDGDIKV